MYRDRESIQKGGAKENEDLTFITRSNSILDPALPEVTSEINSVVVVDDEAQD